MRAELITALQALSLSGFSVSTDLPYTSSGEELYLKNAKRIYVNEMQTDTTVLITLMNGCVINLQTDTVEVIFSTDAKQKPSNYDSVVSSIAGLADSFMNTYNSRTYSLATEFNSDMLVTTVSFAFTKL